MTHAKTVAEWMTQRGIGLAELVASSGLDGRVVEAIVQARYTPSPEQVAWGHQAEVSHVYGHGPQFGRSP